MKQTKRVTRAPRLFAAAVMVLGASIAAHAEDTADFAAIAMGDLGAGVAGYVNAASIIDPVSGVVATGYASTTRGSGYSTTNLSLYRRNQPDDHGLGVCSEGGADFCGPPDGNGDVNELSNQENWEIIVLTLPASREWVSVQISSSDDNSNTGGGPDEEGILYAGTSPTNPATWTKIANLTGDDANREPTIAIPETYKEAPYLIFEAADETTPSNRNNDYLVWKSTVRPVLLECPGTGTPGYWKNHPEAWPVAVITIGGIQYNKAQAIAIMSTTLRGDKTWTMFNALVSAKLNGLIGCDCEDETTDISDTIAAAELWMSVHGPVGSGVAGNSDAWRAGEPLYFTLNEYNNGNLCAPHRG